MLKLLGKAKGFVAGIAVGVMVATSISVFAEGERISAGLAHFALYIDNQFQELPMGQTMLNYNGYTYLPSRYVAEKLGATVDFDQAKGEIRIVSPPAKVIEKIVEVEKGTDPSVINKTPDVTKPAGDPTKTYSPLSVTRSIKDVIVRVDYAMLIDDQLNINMYIENKGQQYPVRVDMLNSKLIVDTKEMAFSSIKTWDIALVNNLIDVGENTTGYLSFPKVDKNTKNFTLKVPVMLSTGSGEEKLDFTFDFSTDLNK